MSRKFRIFIHRSTKKMYLDERKKSENKWSIISALRRKHQARFSNFETTTTHGVGDKVEKFITR